MLRRWTFAALLFAGTLAASARAEEPQNDKPMSVTWATGTVRDTEGKPVAGATVYALAAFSCLREYQAVFPATTDQHGRYTLTGEISYWRAIDDMYIAMLLAYAPGYCPAMTAPPERLGWMMHLQEQPQINAQAVDFVLSKQGGSLEVKVVQDGKPLPDATVNLSLQAAGQWERIQWLPGDGLQAGVMWAILKPTDKTGPNGVARIENLIPGIYRINVSDPPIFRFDSSGGKVFLGNVPRFPPGEAAGVAIKRGAVAQHCLAIYDPESKVALQVFSANGTPLATEEPHIRCPRIEDIDDPGRWGNAKLDEHGLGAETFDKCGLWRWRLFRGYAYENGERAPWDEASTVVAASRLLEVKMPLQLTERHLEAAKVNVRLLDASGRPVRGFAWVDSPQIAGCQKIATDESGAAQLAVRPTCTHRVGGWAEGYDPLFYLFDPPPPDYYRFLREVPVPDAAALRNRCAFSTEPFRPEPGTQAAIVLKAQSVGYVRGQLKPHDGKTTRDYCVQVDNQAEFGSLAWCCYQANSGNFAAGPFLPGKAALTVCEAQEGYPLNKPIGEQEVSIAGGQVTEMEIRPVPIPGAKAGQPQEMLADADGRPIPAAGNALLRGKISMSDGKTPAMGATLSYLSPEIRGEASKPAVAGIADAEGTIQPTGSVPPFGPRGRLAVASLPGTCGGVVVELIAGKPLQVMLPPPWDLKGKVTVGGASPSGMPARIRVLAAYQGKGDFNALLSVETTADSDGRFVLSGLTPGTYEVQAAVDDIWLSPTSTVVVGPGPLADLTLDAGAPGRATSILLTGADGSPLQGEAITLDRPAGPLAAKCWPAEWRSDGAGRINIPTLEVGKHTFHVRVDGSAHEISVPPLSAAGLQEVRVAVHLAK